MNRMDGEVWAVLGATQGLGDASSRNDRACPAVADKDRTGGLSCPKNWVPRFADSCCRQMTGWIGAVTSETAVGATA